MRLPRQVSEVTGAFLDEVDRRLPGRLTGLFLHGSICWGEFFPGSDVDFVGLWDRLPRGEELGALEEAHDVVRGLLPETVFDGFHCTAVDLGRDPARVSPRPVSYRGRFDPAGGIDINLVTWHEMAERPVIARGAVPHVFIDLDRLIEFTRRNLDTYWRGLATQVVAQGVEAVGHDDDAVACSRDLHELLGWLVQDGTRPDCRS